MGACILVLDAPRYADIAHRGQQHDQASRQRDVAGDARPLCAARLLDDLHQQLLPHVQHFADGLAGELTLHLFRIAAEIGLVDLNIADVQKGVFIQPNVHKGRLHAGQYVGHTPQIDVARQLFLPPALDIIFGQLAILQRGQASLPAV